MIGLFQKHKSSLLGAIMIGFCALLMLSFGVESFFGPGQAQYAAVVNNKEISFNEYYRQRESVEQGMRTRFGEQYDMFRQFVNIPQETIDSIINNQLLAEVIKELSLTAGITSIQREVATLPFFEGTLTKENYQTFLRSIGMSGPQLESIIKDELSRKQLIRSLTDLSFYSDRELLSIYQTLNTKASFTYASFNPDNFQSEVKLNDEELENFLQENSERYQTPEKIRYSFVSFNPKDFKKTIKLTDDELLALYDERKATLIEPAQATFKQIFIKKEKASVLENMILGEGEKPTFENEKNKAQQALRRLESGDSFDSVLQSLKLETTPVTSPLGQLEPRITKALDELAINNHSNVIETDEGFFIVQLLRKKDAEPIPFNKIKNDLRKELIEQEAPAFAFAAAYDFYDTIEAKKSSAEFSLAKEARSNSLIAEEVATFLTANIDPDSAPAGLTQKIINYKVGEVEIIELEDTPVIVQILEKQASETPKLEAIKEQVIADYKKENARILAQKKANEFLTSVKNMTSITAELFAQLATEAGGTTSTTELTTRTKSTGSIFTNPIEAQQLFALSNENPIYPSLIEGANEIAVALLNNKEIPNKENVSKSELNELEKSDRLERENRITATLLANLRNKAEIWVNPMLFDLK